MRQTLVLVHTVAPLIAEFDRLCRSMLPGIEMFNILDEPLLEQIRRRGHSTPDDEVRLSAHVAAAEAVGAVCVLVTCSTVSQCVDAIRPACAIPVVAIDEAMVDEAVRLGGTRVALLATNPTTIEPSRALLLSASGRAGRRIEVRQRLVPDALAALTAGDGRTHDSLVEAAIREEAARADVVVLAQATMARALDAMGDAPPPVPVLSSPELALRQVRDLMGLGEDRDQGRVAASGGPR